MLQNFDGIAWSVAVTAALDLRTEILLQKDPQCLSTASKHKRKKKGVFFLFFFFLRKVVWGRKKCNGSCLRKRLYPLLLGPLSCYFYGELFFFYIYINSPSFPVKCKWTPSKLASLTGGFLQNAKDVTISHRSLIAPSTLLEMCLLVSLQWC